MRGGMVLTNIEFVSNFGGLYRWVCIERSSPAIIEKLKQLGFSSCYRPTYSEDEPDNRIQISANKTYWTSNFHANPDNVTLYVGEDEEMFLQIAEAFSKKLELKVKSA